MGNPVDIESNVQSDVVFRRILVPHDLTTRADHALRLAGTMAHPQLSKLVLVNVIDPNDVPIKDNRDVESQVSELARDRWRYLKIAAKRVLPADVDVAVRILSGSPQHVILAEALEFGADLLILTTHPRTGAGYPFNGWVDEQIQLQAPCPVLTVPVNEESGDSIALQKLRAVETHSLKQYCALSRRLSKEESHRPVFIGYAHLPSSLSGVCD
jgi:nucleotide-binding universal stress UspA family protein